MAMHLLAKGAHLVNRVGHLVAIDDATEPADCECCGGDPDCDPLISTCEINTYEAELIISGVVDGGCSGACESINGTFLLPNNSCVDDNATFFTSMSIGGICGASGVTLSFLVTLRCNSGGSYFVSVHIDIAGLIQRIYSAILPAPIDVSTVTFTEADLPLTSTFGGACSFTGINFSLSFVPQ